MPLERAESVQLLTSETDVRATNETVQTWFAFLGEVHGVGSTKSAALRDLADRMDVREAVYTLSDDIELSDEEIERVREQFNKVVEP